MLYYINVETRRVHRFEQCTNQPDGSNREYLGSPRNFREAISEARRRGYDGAQACGHCNR